MSSESTLKRAGWLRRKVEKRGGTKKRKCRKNVAHHAAPRITLTQIYAPTDCYAVVFSPPFSGLVKGLRWFHWGALQMKNDLRLTILRGNFHWYKRSYGGLEIGEWSAIPMLVCAGYNNTGAHCERDSVFSLVTSKWWKSDFEKAWNDARDCLDNSLWPHLGLRYRRRELEARNLGEFCHCLQNLRVVESWSW